MLLTPLKLLISKYKWAILLGLFVVYSAGLWHVSTNYQQAAYLKEKLELEEHNRQLSGQLSTALLEAEAAKVVKNNKDNKVIQDEVQKHPEFADCPVPDSVQQLLDSKLKGR